MNHFDGVINEYPNIACDRFCGDALTCTAFFLSHCHTDHMEGLHTDVFFNYLTGNSSKLYCSLITKRFLSSSKKYKHLKKNICPLRLNETHSVVTRNSKSNEEETVNVTFFKAKHCPGSVMILFEGSGETVLYTGDIRLDGNSLNYRNMPLLYETCGNLKSIAKLYVDTTFCTDVYTTFPSKIESRDILLDAIEPWLKADARHLVFLDCPYKFGCEYLFMELHKKFNMKVHVSKQKKAQYKSIPKFTSCTCDDSIGTQIHACCSLKKNRKRCTIFDDRNADILYVKLSAMYFANSSNGNWIYKFPKSKRYRICYSIHASCEEIQGFVEKLQPKCVHPLVVPLNSDLETVSRLLGINSDRCNQIKLSPKCRKFGQLRNQSLESKDDDMELDGDFILENKTTLSPTIHSTAEEPTNEWNFMISPLKSSQESTFSESAEQQVHSPKWNSLKSSQESTTSDVSVVKNVNCIEQSPKTSVDESDCEITKGIDLEKVIELQEPKSLEQIELKSEILKETVVSSESNHSDDDVEIVYEKYEVIDLTKDDWDSTPEFII
ncbi:Protein artemis [Chamberlinius hualienensis]